MRLPSVSVVVPCRNEAAYVDTFLASVAAQQNVAFASFEVIVADGSSDDGSAERFQAATKRYRWLRIIDNPQRIVPTGLNACIRAASGEVIVRMDMHTEYAADYVYRSVLKLTETGAANVGGPWRARGTTPMSRAIAAAFQSPFGCGGAKGHDLTYEGPVDNGYLGCWYRKTLFDAGLFDEGLVRNQDDELNLRLIRSGGVVWQSPSIISWYTPRASLRLLFRQYYQYGFWKIPVIRKHRQPASIRHLVPGAFVLSCIAIPILGLLLSLTGHPLVGTICFLTCLIVLGLYSAIVVRESLRIASRHGSDLMLRLPAVFVTYHFAYGLGFLIGLLYWPSRPLGLTPQHRTLSGLTR